jgi:hypothetical protein
VTGDYDGDGKSDLAVYQTASGDWYLYQSQAGFGYQPFGASGYAPVEGDYDGDGKSDLAVYEAASGYWFTLGSQSQQLGYQQLGGSGYAAVRGDYDGDGKSDAGVYQTLAGNWYIQVDGRALAMMPFSEVAGAGDVDGDRKTDLAVYQESTGSGTLRPRRWRWGTRRGRGSRRCRAILTVTGRRIWWPTSGRRGPGMC